MQSKSAITLLAVCLLTLFDLNQAQCTVSTTTCSDCDGDIPTCESNPNCRALYSAGDINPNLTPVPAICVNLGSCDSDCTVCPDTAAGCSDASGSRAYCIIAGAGDNAGQCVGFTCALSCDMCGLQAECEASEAEPAGCVWTGAAGSEVCEPGTPSPTTATPTTASPTTDSPTTASPTTASPTTASPTTASTTDSPTSASPTTAAPTTVGPTSEGEDTATTTWWTYTPTTAGGGSSSSGSSSGSWSWSKSSSSSSGWSSSSEVVVDDDTTTARTAWTARIAANRNSEKVWRSVPDLQSTYTNSDDEQEAAGEASANRTETATDKVEWSVGTATMINLWAMLIVCLCGNAVICCIANRKKQENAHFHHDEHETGI